MKFIFGLMGGLVVIVYLLYIVFKIFLLVLFRIFYKFLIDCNFMLFYMNRLIINYEYFFKIFYKVCFVYMY